MELNKIPDESSRSNQLRDYFIRLLDDNNYNGAIKVINVTALWIVKEREGAREREVSAVARQRADFEQERAERLSAEAESAGARIRALIVAGEKWKVEKEKEKAAIDVCIARLLDAARTGDTTALRDEITSLKATLARSIVENEKLFPLVVTRNELPKANWDAALRSALTTADPNVKEGFTLREDYWAGDLGVKQTKVIVHELWKGNEYWFWMGTDSDKARMSVHVYDSDGNLAEAESWQTGKAAAARVKPKTTKASARYYLVVEIEKSDQERTNWALAYGFK